MSFFNDGANFTANGQLMGEYQDPGFVHNFETSFAATQQSGLSISDDLRHEQAYAPILAALNDGKPYLDRYSNPYSVAQMTASYLPYLGITGKMLFGLATAYRDSEEHKIWDAISAARAQNPNFLPGVPASQADFEKQLIDQGRQAVLANSAAAAHAGFGGEVGQFAGSMAAGFEDPINLATLPFAGAGAETILGAALKQGAVNAELAAASQPAVAQNYQKLGFDYGAEDALKSVASSAALGSLFGAGGHALGMAWARLSPGEKIKSFDQAVPNPTPDQAAARTVLQEQADIEEANPLAATPQGNAEHLVRLQEAIDNLTSEAPQPLSDQPSVAVNPESKSWSGGILSLNPRDIGVDVKTFQFKEGGDQAGVTERLQGISKWDPALSGKAIVWIDENGKPWIADGHQRLGLANRLLDQNPNADIRIDAVPYAASDGFTPEDVRVIAARKNIAEGTGTALDAAKIFKSEPDAAINLPSRSALVRDGTSLARLSDDAWGMTVNGVMRPEQAAIVGRLAPDTPELHASYLQVLARTDPANLRQAEGIVRQAIASGHSEGTQAGLFGPETLAETLFTERAKVLDKALTRIREDKRFFQTANRGAAALEAEGNQINADANAARAQSDAELMAVVDRLAYRKGPISDALTAAAKQAKDEGHYGNAVKSFIDAVRSSGDLLDAARAENPDEPRAAGLSDLGGGPAGGTGRSDQTQGAAPDLFGEPEAGPDLATSAGDNARAEPLVPGHHDLAEPSSDTFLKSFDEPAGPGQSAQTKILSHDLQADLGDKTAEFRVGMDETRRDGETRAVTKSVKEVLDELDAEDQAIKNIEDCL